MGMLIVSYDRHFLNQTVNGILEIDPNSHMMRSYPGNYNDYLEAKMTEYENQMQAYQDQQEQITRLRRAAIRVRGNAKLRKSGKGDDGDKFAKGFFSDRASGTISRAKSIERRLEYLNGKRVDKPKKDWQMKLAFTPSSVSGQDVILFENATIGYKNYLLIEELNLTVSYGQRIVLIGANGSGKTTFFKTIQKQISPVSGIIRLGSNVKLGVMAQEQKFSNLEMDVLTCIRSIAALSETEARTFLHQFPFSGDQVFTLIGMLSYGERARLSLACLVA